MEWKEDPLYQYFYDCVSIIFQRTLQIFQCLIIFYCQLRCYKNHESNNHFSIDRIIYCVHVTVLKCHQKYKIQERFVKICTHEEKMLGQMICFMHYLEYQVYRLGDSCQELGLYHIKMTNVLISIKTGLKKFHTQKPNNFLIIFTLIIMFISVTNEDTSILSSFVLMNISNTRILGLNFIINMITQMANAKQNMAEIIQQINSNNQFRMYHQQNQKKGIFNIVKCSFDEMISHLQNFNKNLYFDNIMQISDFLKDGVKVWAYSQYKIFAWVSAWLQFQRKIHLNQIIEQNSYEVQILQLFFPHKPQVFLRYEFFLMFTKMNKLKTLWTQQEIQFLTKYINSIEAASKDKTQKIKWRSISFQLFVQKQCLKTPNQCRERWVNHLNPKVKKTDWTIEQDIKMLTLYQELGSKWSYISKLLKTRTEHMVKNRFNSLKHKWNTSNHQNTAFNPSLILKRLRNRLKANNCDKSPKGKNTIEEYQPKKLQNSKINSAMIDQKPKQQAIISQVKIQNFTLSLFDVCPWQAANNANFQQNDIIIKQQADNFQYFFQTFSLQNHKKMNESEELEWLDDLMEKKCHQELFQYM